MADISDVTAALGALIGTALYPAGATGEAASPVAGAPVLVEEGWPDPKGLQTAAKAGKAVVSLYPRPGERNTTRYPREWRDGAINATTYTLIQAGQVVTVGGTAPSTYTPQNLVIFVNGTPYVVQATDGQTAAQLAAALQALIVVDIAGTTVLGAAITLPATARIGALRVGATGTGQRELRRQDRQIQIIVWAPTPEMRTAVAKAVDAALAPLDFIDLVDGTSSRLMYHGSPVNDFDQKQGVYRRDLFYSVEYATTETAVLTQIEVLTENFRDPFDNLVKTINR